MMTTPTTINRRAKRQRRGVSLMEVLISTFVLSIGLLGIASLIPVGKMSMFEGNKYDRSGQSGRAALHDVKVRRMADFRTWATAPAPDSTNPFSLTIIDPLGLSRSLPPNLGGVPRITLSYVSNAEAAEYLFRCRDDLAFQTPSDKTNRPFWTPNQVGNYKTDNDGNYSWFCTVMPSLSEVAVPWGLKTQFDVSVAVVFKRGFGNDENGVSFEQVVQGQFQGAGGIAYGGGAFLPATRVIVKENEWVLAVGAGQAQWYRVTAAGAPLTNGDTSDAAKLIALAGPDWNTATSSNVTLIVIKGVIGVYSQTMELDNDPAWAPL